MSKLGGPNCIDLVNPVIDELGRQGLLEGFQLMGGIGSAALQHPDTVILPNEKRIVTAPSFLIDNPNLQRYRQDDKGKPTTLRDMDALVLSANEARVKQVEAIADALLGPTHDKDGKLVEEAKLEVSVFGLRRAAQVREQVENPFGISVLKTFVSDRYADDDGTMLKALVPLAVPLRPEAIEGWTAEIDDREYAVMNPAVAMLSYETRSITGLRPKDYAKVQKMAKLIVSMWPEVGEWMVDGPGKEQTEMATGLQTLRRANSWPKSKRVLTIGDIVRIEAGSVRALREHESFMYRDASGPVQDAALLLATIKSRAVGIPESNPAVVDLFQTFAEKRLNTITKNQWTL